MIIWSLSNNSNVFFHPNKLGLRKCFSTLYALPTTSANTVKCCTKVVLPSIKVWTSQSLFMSQSSVLPATLTGQKEAKQNKIWFQTSTNIYSLERNSMQSNVAVQCTWYCGNRKSSQGGQEGLLRGGEWADFQHCLTYSQQRDNE